ncbi:site-specific DNA-methyltransferase (adenine-specific) [Novimethylophilus kurashikiensis]|uniref:Site-specific DNA-methyltransferase (Adenine-specific) n=1 Tax=Novimethylophilus kurashikiensis TaxID=1825523 RepID=A0A2R5FBJ4_9PROT|nr:site-specific DNA-methyltransferase (adenine-specific) [Novimethylophilus kurashikiensis]
MVGGMRQYVLQMSPVMAVGMNIVFADAFQHPKMRYP